MQDILPDGGVIRKLWIGEPINIATICCGSIRRAGTAASAAACPTTSSAISSICRFRSTRWCMAFLLTA